MRWGIQQRGSSRWGGLAFGGCGLLMLLAGWLGWQQWGILPTPEVHRVEVPIKLPPDGKLMRRFEKSLQQAAYQDEALLTLFRVWGFEPTLDEANCEAANRVGLQCQQGSGSLKSLLELDHPAVVRLFDEMPPSFTPITVGEEADLLIDGEGWTVSREWLEQAWGDEYTLLWRLPKSGAHGIAAQQ